MVMQGIEFGINDLYTAALTEDFTSLDNGVLTINPFSNPYPRPQSKHVVSMQGGYLDLRLFDLHPDAHEFCRYWEYLVSTESHHRWPLAKIVRYLLRRQGGRVASGYFSMYPDWAKLAELVGLMYYFQENCTHANAHWGTELEEISTKLAGTINGDQFPGNNGEWLQKGLPDLHGKIKSYVTELRFAQEVHRAGYDLTFLEEKGDVLIKTDPTLTIDATRFYPGYGLEFEEDGEQRVPKVSGVPDRVTLESVANEIREAMKPAVVRKFENHDTDIDGIAVDTTQSLSGVKFMCITQLEQEPPSVGEQIETMVEAKRGGEQPILNFQFINGSSPHTIATCTTRSRIMRQYRPRVQKLIRQIRRQLNNI